jgi:ATP-dependent exoDNAse (exonuclease V) beta subunit
VSQRYREILVDEYQDVNAVQELIFTSVSQNERNMFMVGDEDQLIYTY